MAGKNIKFLEKSPVKLNFTKKLMTPYGGFVLLARLSQLSLEFRRNENSFAAKSHAMNASVSKTGENGL